MHPALLHHGDPVRHGERLDLVMRDVEDRQAGTALDALQFGAHLFAELGVEIRQGLVEQKHARLDGEGAPERHALLLPAGELCGHARTEPGHVEHVEGRAHALGDHATRRATDLERIADILGDAHMRPDGIALEDHADGAVIRRSVDTRARIEDAVPTDGDAPLIGALEPRDASQGRGLAAARGAEQGEELALAHDETDIIHRADLAEPLDEIVDAHRLAHASLRKRRSSRRANQRIIR
jgi:hypothetical protein